MAWGTLRQATDDDVQRLTSAAQRFCVRHGIDQPGNVPVNGFEFVNAIEDLVANMTDPSQQEWTCREGAYLGRLWRRCVRRALGPGADGIAYGYVGYSVE